VDFGELLGFSEWCGSELSGIGREELDEIN